MINQPSLFPEDSPEFCYEAEDDMTTKFTKFFIERHMIYLRRNLMRRDPPWTRDPILANYRFCNIYRELDTVSQWIINNVIVPNEDNPNLPVLLGLARFINWPDTLRDLMDANSWPVHEFDRNKFYRVLDERRSNGKKFVTGSYMVNTVYPKNFKKRDPSKAGYIADITAADLWLNREELTVAAKTTLKKFFNTLTKYHGWGPFIAYQVVVDLTYSKKWLGRAKDLNTFNSPGPGTQKGLNYYFAAEYTGSKRMPKTDLGPRIVQQRDEVNSKLKELLPPEHITGNMQTGFEPLTLSNVSNLCCEFSKHYAMFIGKRDRLKNTYKPTRN